MMATVEEHISVYSFNSMEELRGYAKQLRYELYQERELNRKMRRKARLHKQAIRELQTALERYKWNHRCCCTPER